MYRRVNAMLRHGAEFRAGTAEPVLKFCSMSEVHAGLICSTAPCTRGGVGKRRGRKDAGMGASW